MITNKVELFKYLNILNFELGKSDLTGEMLLTGRAVMFLVHSARDMTKDIDTLYEPKTEINDIVKKIADEYDLPENRLNDSVKGFINENIETSEFLNLGNLKISTVTQEYLLAMKLMSSRTVGQDLNDIKFLCKKMELRTQAQVESIVEKFFHFEKILPKTKYVIQDCLEQLESENQE